MKIRTDFVTNSSSSSFIFGEPCKKDLSASDVLKEIRDNSRILMKIADIAYEKYKNACSNEICELLPNNMYSEHEYLLNLIDYDVYRGVEEKLEEIIADVRVNLGNDEINQWGKKAPIDYYLACSILSSGYEMNVLKNWDEMSDDFIKDIDIRVNEGKCIEIPNEYYICDITKIDELVMDDKLIMTYGGFYDEDKEGYIPSILSECLCWYDDFKYEKHFKDLVDKGINIDMSYPSRWLGQILIGRICSQSVGLDNEILSKSAVLDCPHMG